MPTLDLVLASRNSACNLIFASFLFYQFSRLRAVYFQVYFYHCTNVDFLDFTLVNSPKLTLVPKPCDNVRIYNVSPLNRSSSFTCVLINFPFVSSCLLLP